MDVWFSNGSSQFILTERTSSHTRSELPDRKEVTASRIDCPALIIGFSSMDRSVFVQTPHVSSPGELYHCFRLSIWSTYSIELQSLRLVKTEIARNYGAMSFPQWVLNMTRNQSCSIRTRVVKLLGYLLS